MGNPLEVIAIPFERIARRLDRTTNYYAIFLTIAVLLLVKLAPVNWNGNEEDYFQLAFRRVSPESFSPFSAAFDHSNGRMIAEYLLGSLIRAFGYERAHFIARIGMALFYALGLTFLFSRLKANALESLFVICAFCFAGEQLIGGEWLFKGVEGKTLSYATLFFAFGFACENKWRAAIVTAVLSTYLHFLVGGFWSSMLLLWLWYQSRDLKRTAKFASLFFAACLPLIIIILNDQLSNGSSTLSTDGLSADFIYSGIRNDGHVAPFAGLYAIWGWSPGVLATFLLLTLLTVLWKRKLAHPIAIVAIASLMYLFVALVVAFLDRHTYHFGKFYLFRPSSLALFLAMTVVVLAIRQSFNTENRPLFSLIATAFVTLIFFDTLKTQLDITRAAPAIPFKTEMLSAIKANSTANEIVLIEPYDEMNPEYIHLHLDIPRPTLISWKFVPTNQTEIIRWYSLILERNKLFESGCPNQLSSQVGLLLVFHQSVANRVQNCGDVVWQHGEASLIKVGHPS